jgi:hypothetical protein
MKMNHTIFRSHGFSELSFSNPAFDGALSEFTANCCHTKTFEQLECRSVGIKLSILQFDRSLISSDPQYGQHFQE